MINPAVVIPVHKEDLSANEIGSLRQCNKILGKHQIYIVSPENLSLKNYKILLPTAKEIRVDPKWMSSVRAYNRMMISPMIYKKFSSHSHVLIHEPDAIVLNDELEFWCHKSYDFVGAPWFKEGLNNNNVAYKVGNFGFSLINVKKAIEITNSNKRWYPYINIARDIFRGICGKKEFLKKGFNGLGAQGKLKNAHRLFDENCDVFWCNLIPKLKMNFKIAPIAEAAQFSWEAEPRECQKIGSKNTPFGIHAWAGWDPEFIVPILLEIGVKFEPNTKTTQFTF